MNLISIAMVIVAATGLLGTFVWYLSSVSRRNVCERFDALEKQIDEAKVIANTVRTEMYAEFVRHTHYDKAIEAVNENIKGVYDIIGALSKDLNQLIGEFRASQDK
ncbi:MAG: hypothetical protein FVQ79_00625 [Planctomycetes bacterium]|nr:hypothetical protein [Planctomycetota bacterium]